jgi:two-component system, sensor histidine kinase
MIKAREDILRKASQTTLILQVFSGGLLIVLSLLYMDISKRYSLLQDGIRENAMWSVYQLDREARAVDYDLGLALRVSNVTAKGLSDASLRYDILYSRVNVLVESRFQDFFAGDQKIVGTILDLKADILAIQPVFDRINSGQDIDITTLRQLTVASADLVKETQSFLIYTNSKISENRTDSRDYLSRLHVTSAVFLLLLAASVVFLILTLSRQLNAMRQTGLAMETMAHKVSEAYNAADAGNRAKSQFMATIGHEIRTPLNAILGMAELLEQSVLPPGVKENVRTIRSSGESLLEVLNEILDYAKIEHGKLELEDRAVDLRELAETTVNMIRARAVEHGNTIVLDMPAILPAPVVKTDPTRLRQVILNLMSNAVKFTDKGTITLRMGQILYSGRLALRIEVKDTGIGIDESGKTRLFKPFSQVDSSISRKYGGTGLGLTICKQIVEQLGGTLGIESALGQGSTFWLEIPVEPVAEQPRAQVKTCEGDLSPLPPIRILLVEDNKVNQQVATRFLERLNQTADLACHGGEAVIMAGLKQYDLVLMDMQMPVMDGIEATRLLIAGGGINSTTPIVAMTANASDDDRRACVDAGMQGFELKPMTLHRLHNLLARIAKRQGNTVPNFAAKEQMPEELATDPVQHEGNAGVPKVSTLLSVQQGLDELRRQELIAVLGEEDFNALLQSFFVDAGLLLNELSDATRSGDQVKVDRVLHSIKGSAANVGFSSIAELADAFRQKTPGGSDTRQLQTLIETQKTRYAA